jgi:type II secretion system protein G
MYKVYKKKLKGFTLIELLVVVAIISLLSSVVLASLNSSRVKARDAIRKSDMHSLRTAIELYYISNNGTWPNTDGNIDANTTKSGDWPSAFKTALSPYISSLPLDPLVNNVGRFYGAQPMTWSPDPDCNGKYVLWTYIEGSNPNANTCGWSSPHYFLILGSS